MKSTRTITNVAGLHVAIAELENQQSEQGMVIKKRFDDTMESLRPVNLIKSSFSGDLMSTALALATGYLSKRLLVGSTGKLLNTLIGNIMQYGVTALLLKKKPY
jgi:hypothetical protein